MDNGYDGIEGLLTRFPHSLNQRMTFIYGRYVENNTLLGEDDGKRLYRRHGASDLYGLDFLSRTG